MRDCNFLLRTEHQQQVAKILADPEASENDKYVAVTMLRNAEIAAKGVLPFCQIPKPLPFCQKGHLVYTDGTDERLYQRVYQTYTQENLRYSQNAALNMYEEVNTKTNLPAKSI